MVTTIILGGITHHYLASDLNYCNTINNYGTIQNNYISIMSGYDDNKLGIIFGKDSACGDIRGILSSFNLKNNFEFMIGGYNTNFSQFKKRNIIPPSINEVTPIVGINYKIPINNNFSIDTLISYGIITHGIAITF